MKTIFVRCPSYILFHYSSVGNRRNKGQPMGKPQVIQIVIFCCKKLTSWRHLSLNLIGQPFCTIQYAAKQRPQHSWGLYSPSLFLLHHSFLILWAVNWDTFYVFFLIVQAGNHRFFQKPEALYLLGGLLATEFRAEQCCRCWETTVPLFHLQSGSMYGDLSFYQGKPTLVYRNYII